MELIFIGAAGTVTGSKCLIKEQDHSYLVDAGLYQGEKWLTQKNLSPLRPGLAKSLDGIFITHGHLDHCGYLPYLVNQGFSGPIFLTEPTQELVKIVLEDAYTILKNDFDKKKIETLPYTEDDLAKVISMMVLKDKEVDYEHEKLKFKFFEAGHILGACSLWLAWNNTKVLFSGDLGRSDDLIHKAPVVCNEDVDVIVIEGTYGGRSHPTGSVESTLIESIEHVRSREGVLFIPSFAIARSAVVLKVLNDFFIENPSLKLQIYVDSPMMIKALRTYVKYAKDLKITKEELNTILDSVKLVEYPKDRKKLLKVHPPYILLSSSGMLSGGRSMQHFDRIAIKDYNQILFVGYQGVGTLGRKVLDGEKSFVATGKKREVRAKVDMLDQLSAHADENEMVSYLKQFKIKKGKSLYQSR
jgi:metallo-beta-lactamase family protein